MQTITLSASAAYGFGGKQYIARITGRDAKFTFARDFIGRKGGKRGESAEATVDEPGLYVTCDVDRKGNKDDTYCLVWRAPNGDMYSTPESLEEAMAIAKRLDAHEDPSAIGCAEIRELYRTRNVDDAGKDPSEEIEIKVSAIMADAGGISSGKRPRRAIIEARKRVMAVLGGASEEEAAELHPADVSLPSAADIDHEIAELEARISALRLRRAVA